MAVLPVLPVDHPMLRRKSSRLRNVSNEVRCLVADMFETMDRYRGVGLSANQIGRPWRVIVVGIECDRFAVINPRAVEVSGAEVADEGCLSLPNWFGPVERATQVTIKGLDARGQALRRRASGLLARVLLHEIDHLDGTIFTDRLTDPAALRFVDPRSAEAQRMHAA